MAKKSRFIRSVDDQTWFKFAGYSKLEGKTQAQFLASLIKLYEQFNGENLEEAALKLQKILEKRQVDHFTIFKFTTEWKACLGTPNLDTGEGREQVRKLKGCKTLAEAVRWAIENQVEPY